jgi:hypothetical protein
VRRGVPKTDRFHDRLHPVAHGLIISLDRPGGNRCSVKRAVPFQRPKPWRPNMSLMCVIGGGNGMGRVGCDGGQVKHHGTARGTGGDGTSRATIGGCIVIWMVGQFSRRGVNARTPLVGTAKVVAASIRSFNRRHSDDETRVAISLTALPHKRPATERGTEKHQTATSLSHRCSRPAGAPT